MCVCWVVGKRLLAGVVVLLEDRGGWARWDQSTNQVALSEDACSVDAHAQLGKEKECEEE